MVASTKLDPRRTAVLTSDLQYAAAYKHAARRSAVEAFLPGVVRFLGQARTLGMPVYHLQLVTPLDDPRAQNVEPEFSYAEGTPGVQLLDSVAEPSDIIVPKLRDSGFFNTPLDDLLKAAGIETVVLTGMQAQICIQTTAADAFFRGYKVIVPSDGVVSTRQDDVDRAIGWMGSYCAQITTMSEFIDGFRTPQPVEA
jgi:nicotinamidase-related amidase